jgi:hypothetical protein
MLDAVHQPDNNSRLHGALRLEAVLGPPLSIENLGPVFELINSKRDWIRAFETTVGSNAGAGCECQVCSRTGAAR